MNSFDFVNPGIKFLYFNQYIAQKAPEKNIPSTIVKAINLFYIKSLFLFTNHFKAQLAFFYIHGIYSIALNNLCFSY